MFVHDSAFHSSKVKLVLHQSLSLTKTICQQLGLIDMYEHLASIVCKLHKMRITQEEYLCLKVIALFKSDYGFANLEKLEEIRRKCFKTLKLATMRADKSSTESSWSYRYDSFLLLLADIKCVSMRFMHFIITCQDDPKKLPNLLYDMFLTQKVFGLATGNLYNLSRNSSISCASDLVMETTSCHAENPNNIEVNNEPTLESNESHDQKRDEMTDTAEIGSLPLTNFVQNTNNISN